MKEPSEQTTEEIWTDFWYPIFAEADRKGREEDPHYVAEHQVVSNAVFEQMKKELADFRVMMHEVNLAYCEVTGGYISKPNTASRHVIDRVEDRIQEQRDEAQKEMIEYLRDQDEGDLADLLAVHFGVTGNPNFDNKGDRSAED